MIIIDRGLRIEPNSSAFKFLKYLDKTNQDLVVVPRRPNQPSGAGAVETREALVKPVSEDATQQNSVSQYHVTESPSGTLVGNWSVKDTLSFKKYLSSLSNTNVVSLVRVGDLGIRSTGEPTALGVILKATYSLSNDQSRRHHCLKCYVISNTCWSRQIQFICMSQVKGADIFVRDQQNLIHHINRGRK